MLVPDGISSCACSANPVTPFAGNFSTPPDHVVLNPPASTLSFSFNFLSNLPNAAPDGTGPMSSSMRIPASITSRQQYGASLIITVGRSLLRDFVEGFKITSASTSTCPRSTFSMLAHWTTSTATVAAPTSRSLVVCTTTPSASFRHVCDGVTLLGVITGLLCIWTRLLTLASAAMSHNTLIPVLNANASCVPTYELFITLRSEVITYTTGLPSLRPLPHADANKPPRSCSR